MSTKLPRLATIGEVARELGAPVHRVAYVLRTRSDIVPRAIAGNARCFDDPAIARIRHEMAKIDARRHKGASRET
jgi:hypothetical protein